jgi:hypothetical protein
MEATALFRVFCLSISFLNTLRLKYKKAIILPEVLYGCETLSLTLREEHGLRVFENRVRRRKFVPKREEVEE